MGGVARLQAVALAHPQAAHPHVGEQHLAAGVSDEVSVFGGDGELQTRGVAPVLQFVCQQLHGHLLIVFVRLIEQFVRQLSKLPRQKTQLSHHDCRRRNHLASS